VNVAGERRWNRAIRWIFSVEGDPRLLSDLDRAMTAFYSAASTRARYQQMLDAEESSQPATERAFGGAIAARGAERVLEFGCGSGRLYPQLRAAGFRGRYLGVEMSTEVIARNAERYPEASWKSGSILETELPLEAFDVVCSYFVLEHCVYPERVLKRAMELVKPSGVIVLVFPDFVEMGRFGSQMLGRREGRASEHLRRGKPLSGVFALYESRIRLPRALRRAVGEFGPFPVNLNVKCLVDGSRLEPDTDAVYVSSRAEVQSWPNPKGFG